MRRPIAILALLGLVALSACQRTAGFGVATDAPAKGTGMTDMVELHLTAEPLAFAYADRRQFTIRMTAVNQGDALVDPALDSVTLLVNEVESTAWNLAVANGRRDDKWFALPPGEAVSMSWSSLGASLFPAPGEYTLVFVYGERRLPALVVTVGA
mgnify:CR=1 FL=1